MDIKVYSDPGHAWFAVKVMKLQELGIIHKISSFSYIKGYTAYLEEDCDGSLLIKTLREKEIPYNLIEKVSDKPSPIRNYEPFPNLSGSNVLGNVGSKIVN